MLTASGAVSCQDRFFEWQATKSGKQPYAIGMKNGAPFGLAVLWENDDPTILILFPMIKWIRQRKSARSCGTT